MRSPLVSVFLLFSAVVLFLSGCGGAGDLKVKVTGSVTKDGKPIEGAVVSFMSENDKSNDSKGANTDSQGKFQVLVKPGKYAVTVSKIVDAKGNVPKSSDVPAEDFAQLEAQGKLKQVIPESYLSASTSPFKADIPKEGKDLPPFEVK
jgi:hypothetical protein